MKFYLAQDYASADPNMQRAVIWLRDQALPLWSSSAGWDAEHGGCVESLDLTGAPNLDVNKRVRVQARQLYVYAHAAMLGHEASSEHAERIAEYLVAKAQDHARGGFIHMLSPDGAVVDARRDMYDQAFVLLGLAWAQRAIDVPGLKDQAAAILDYVDRDLRNAAYGGYDESDMREQPRRQNPHMHWFEALLALFETTGDEDLIIRADAIVDLFRNHFFDEETGTLGEYFTEDWTRVSGPAGNVAEPGHHFEWVWLLHKYRRLGGRYNVKSHAQRLYRFACDHGLDEAGFAVDELDCHGNIVRGSRRCWPQTEALKAHITAARWWDEDVSASVERLFQGLFDTYLNVTPPGAWQDQFDAEGQPMAKAVPASSFYHVMLAFAETLDFWDSGD